ncbi:MAG: efflux transporter outer membrane subunit [Candidatus Accumulibacter sp.]|jgi:NodT family efflux transporter outer membrane factor (OMF) lipoprotein|nr:efflux transporter outer membrane subunit [Accumulibacter sp.]
MKRTGITFIRALAFLLTGCAVGPNFRRPENALGDVRLDAADTAGHASRVSQDEKVPNAWWVLLGDPQLNSLEARAHEANLDLQSAYARIDQSRAGLGIVAAELLPALGAHASYSRQALSAHGPMAALGAPTYAQNLWQTGLAALWYLDLWGGNRRLREMAVARGLSKVYEKEVLHVALSAEIAKAYILLRGMQSQLDIARANERIAEEIVSLVETRRKNGVATRYEIALAKSELEQVSALVVGYAHQCKRLMNGLASLLAQAPGSLDTELEEHRDVPALPPKVPVGLPSELARRRPDIRRAEENLHAATASIGVAQANFYPSITLTGTLGLQAFDRRDLGFWDSRWFAAGPSVSLPLFQGGRLVHALELKKTEHVEAALLYRKTVLTAWHEVDNALCLFADEQKRTERLRLSFEESERAFAKLKRSHQEGEVAYLELLTGRRNVLARRSSFEAAKTQSVAALAALYKAVGGGWDDERLITDSD